MNLGYRSPEQTFATFQAGVRGNLARLEFLCFSVGFRTRNNMGQLAYREFRERELMSQPWFKLGVADAEIIRSEAQSPLRQRILAESHGYQFALELVREDAWQAWAGEQLLADELMGSGGFESYVELVESPGSAPTIITGAQLPQRYAGLELAELQGRITEFRLAMEWKIDSIRQVTEAEPASPAMISPPNSQPPSP